MQKSQKEAPIAKEKPTQHQYPSLKSPASLNKFRSQKDHLNSSLSVEDSDSSLKFEREQLLGRDLQQQIKSNKQYKDEMKKREMAED